MAEKEQTKKVRIRSNRSAVYFAKIRTKNTTKKGAAPITTPIYPGINYVGSELLESKSFKDRIKEGSFEVVEENASPSTKERPVKEVRAEIANTFNIDRLSEIADSDSRPGVQKAVMEQLDALKAEESEQGEDVENYGPPKAEE